MPTSVLLAVLAAAGLLALAPALVRRYDATERLVAERASSTARVLSRQRRRRTVPGRAPINPARPRQPDDETAEAAAPEPAGARREAAGGRGTRGPASGPARGEQRGRPVSAPPYRSRRRPRPLGKAELRRWWRRRRLRVLLTLAALCVVEAVGATLIGPGFLVGLSLSVLFFGWYVAVLRNQVIARRRQRIRRMRIAAEHAAALAIERRRLAERRRRIAEARDAAQRYARERAAEERSRDPSGPGLRGQSYEARAVNF